MENLVNAFRMAARRLLRAPGFTLAAVVTLALGIGANTAIFSVIHAVLLRPLPYPEADRLVRLWEAAEDGEEGAFSTVSPPNFIDFRALEAVFEDAAAHYNRGLTLTDGGPAERLAGSAVTPSLFSILRVAPAIGRTFRDEEESPGKDRVAILSHALWQGHFGGDPAIVGRTIQLDGDAYEVVGVMPRGFGYPDGAEVWVPAAFSAEELATNRGGHYLTVVARLRPGVTLERANAEIKDLAARLAERYPNTNAGTTARVVGLHEDRVGVYRPALLIMAGAVALVLLIACANVASLFLVRALDRERDLAVRTALGAGRGLLVGELLAESVLLGMTGGVAGLLIAAWGTDALVALQSTDVPGLADVGLNSTVLTFTLVISIVTGVAFGLVPAWRVSSPGGLAANLKEGRGQSESRTTSRFRGGLVVGEIALALLLLTGATLLIRSFMKLTAVELGFQPERVLSFSIALPESRYTDAQQASGAVERLLVAAGTVPGIEAAAGVFGLPLGGISYMFNVQTMDGRQLEDGEPGAGQFLQTRVATPDYLEVMRIPLRAGRFLERTDRAGAERAVVLNERAARLLFPDGDPLGHTIELGTDLGLGGPRVGGRVVGVIGDVRHFGPAREAPPEAYFAHAQFPLRSLSIAVRTNGAPGAVVGALRERLAEIDPELPIYRVRTMDQLASASVTQPRFYMMLLTLFGAVALALAAVGTYGSINYSVERRNREIGIRMAMGARGADVLALVVGRVVRLAALGLAIGLVAGLFLSRILDRLLFGLSATDPVTLALATVVLGGVALLAGYLPARRAARVDPITVLRSE